MAKLFCTVENERTEKHQIGNKILIVKVFYGSKENSKLAIKMAVFPTEERPIISIAKEPKQRVIVYDKTV